MFYISAASYFISWVSGILEYYVKQKEFQKEFQKSKMATMERRTTTDLKES